MRSERFEAKPGNTAQQAKVKSGKVTQLARVESGKTDEQALRLTMWRQNALV